MGGRGKGCVKVWRGRDGEQCMLGRVGGGERQVDGEGGGAPGPER
jgi:hypothetical protein